MNLKNQPPIFVPAAYQDNIEKLSKAALMDIVWDMAKQLTPAQDDGSEATDQEVAGTLWSIAETINTYRKREHVPHKARMHAMFGK